MHSFDQSLSSIGSGHPLSRPVSRPTLNLDHSGSPSSVESAASRLSGNSASLQSNGNNGALLNVPYPPNMVGGSPSPANPNTPYWWRPHLSKLPSLKQQQQRDQQQQNSLSPQHSLLRPAYAGQAIVDTGLARDSPSLTGLHSSQLDSHTLGQGMPTMRTQDAYPTGNQNGSSKSSPQKTGAWLLVVGGLIAVVVAFLIVCSLFACTNYLFFPPKRKSTASTSGSSGTATLPLSGLRSQLIGTPTGQTPYLTHQYQMQTHLQYTQPHYEYPLQHTIIK
jgi:hypothetical protein